MNKTGKSTYAGFVLVLLAVSLFAAGFASAQAPVMQPVSSPVIIATPTPTPSPTPAPTPTPSPTPVPNVSLDYSEVSQTTEDSDTVVVLRITATYNFGEPMTYDYQNFVLQIRTPRGGLEPFPIYYLTDSVKASEIGSTTVDSNNPHADFTLTFRFSTIQSSFGGQIHFAYYELVYNSDGVSQSTTPTPTPSPTPTATPPISYSPTATPTQTTPTQPATVGSLSGWLQIGAAAAVGVVIVLLLVLVVLLLRRVRVLEAKVNRV